MSFFGDLMGGSPFGPFDFDNDEHMDLLVARIGAKPGSPARRAFEISDQADHLERKVKRLAKNIREFEARTGRKLEGVPR